ncbi:MAG TPA: response regulator [Cyclobacteriaceae bacterium]|nr:response regulator [Cyclobacteriaceae bacterium]
MEPAKILILEDEFIVAEDISAQLSREGYQVTGIFDNGMDAIAAVRNNAPDIALIDINIQGDIDGIETAGIIAKIVNIPLIFVTAYSGHSYIDRAKKVKPHAYIVKPFNFLNLVSAIELALYNFQNNRQIASSLEAKVTPTEEQFRNYLVNDFLFLKRGNRFDKINTTDILYLEADGSYCHVFTRSGKYTLSQNLQKVLLNIKNGSFVRTHRSFAINIKHVTGRTKSSLLINNFRIPISSQYKEAIMVMMKSL